MTDDGEVCPSRSTARGNCFSLFSADHILASQRTTPNREKARFSPRPPVSGLPSPPATPLASDRPNPPTSYLSFPQCPPIPNCHPEDSLAPPQRWSPFLQPSSSQRSHPTAHSTFNGHGPRISSPPSVSNQAWGSPIPIKKGHTPKLAAYNSP